MIKSTFFEINLLTNEPVFYLTMSDQPMPANILHLQRKFSAIQSKFKYYIKNIICKVIIYDKSQYDIDFTDLRKNSNGVFVTGHYAYHF